MKTNIFFFWVILWLPMSLQAQFGISTAAQTALQKAQFAKQIAELKAIKGNLNKSNNTLKSSLSTQKGIQKNSTEQLRLQQDLRRSMEQVSSSVRNYRRVKTIISRQLLIVSLQNESLKRFIKDKNFKAQEVKAIADSYKILIRESLQILSELRLILRSGAIRMSDAERLAAIDSLDQKMKHHYGLTRYYTDHIIEESRLRSETQADVAVVNRLYGLPN